MANLQEAPREDQSAEPYRIEAVRERVYDNFYATPEEAWEIGRPYREALRESLVSTLGV